MSNKTKIWYEKAKSLEQENRVLRQHLANFEISIREMARNLQKLTDLVKTQNR